MDVHGAVDWHTQGEPQGVPVVSLIPAFFGNYMDFSYCKSA